MKYFTRRRRMAFMQVAKLFLRGSIFNVTLKNLAKEQRDELENVINKVMKDPKLEGCKRAFCRALATTIRNEYTDFEYAEQDYRIAIMKGALQALYGENRPPIAVLTEPVQRKKWFQTWAFEYIRQILRENKLPKTNLYNTIKIPASEAALKDITDLLREHGIEDVEFESGPNNYWLLFDNNDYLNLDKISHKYFKKGIEIEQDICGIHIRVLKKCFITSRIVEAYRAKVNSFDIPDEEGKTKLEAATMVSTTQEVEQCDVMHRLNGNLPDDAQKILRILYEDTRPDDYVNTYGYGTPKICHMAKYLNMNTREVKRLRDIIKCQCYALGIGT
jgi:hypothetical protein